MGSNIGEEARNTMRRQTSAARLVRAQKGSGSDRWHANELLRPEPWAEAGLLFCIAADNQAPARESNKYLKFVQKYYIEANVLRVSPEDIA